MSNISKEQILEGVNGEIKRLTRMLECRTAPLWSETAIQIWQNDLAFYRAIRTLIESSVPAEKESRAISEEAASLMDTTGGGRATADLVSAPSPGPSSSVEGYPASVKQALAVPAPLPAEVEEAMARIGVTLAFAFELRGMKSGKGVALEHGKRDSAALAVIKAALSQSTPVCREKTDMPCGKDAPQVEKGCPNPEAYPKISDIEVMSAPPTKVTREWVEETAATLACVKWRSIEEQNKWLTNRLREKGIAVEEKP